MLKKWLFLILLPFPLFASEAGKNRVEELRHCIMENDVEYCHQHITSNSMELFDRFTSYQLMPCLPTDFTYQSEEKKGVNTVIKATLPPEGKITHSFRLVFIGDKLDIPETFHLGFGEQWQNRINVSEQLFLMMRQNMQGKLSCDIIMSLVKPQK